MALRSDRLDAIVSLSKRRGFVYPSSDKSVEPPSVYGATKRIAAIR